MRRVLVWGGNGERVCLCTQIVRRNKNKKQNQMWELHDRETLEEV